MPCGFDQYLRLTIEATPGTYDSGGDFVWVRLTGPNAFTVRPTPIFQEIRSADGGNRKRQLVHGRTSVGGSLNTLLWPEQAAFFLALATDLVDNALPSFTADYFDTNAVRRTLGCQLASYKLVSNPESDSLTQSMEIIAIKPDVSAPTLVRPATTVFPSETPYIHRESRTRIKRDGAAISTSGFEFNVTNFLTAPFEDDEYVSFINYGGRDVSLTLKKLFVDQSWRNAYEAKTALAFEAQWLRSSPSSSLKIDFGSTNYVRSVTDNLDLGEHPLQDISLDCFYSVTDSTDLTVTVV